jgi:hypothetical protein
MDKKIAGLLGAVAAFATMDAAHAAIPVVPNPADALKADSYADLLNPVPNAALALKADDEARAARQREGVELVQYFRRDSDHHHHHHRYFRREIPRVFLRRGDDHHHHHHHHHQRFDRY